MRLKTQRRAIYAAMGLTVLALTGGFALANLSLGSSGNQVQQGSHTTSITPVVGLTWDSTTLTEVGTGGVTNTTGCASSAGCSVTSASATVCAGSTHSGTWCAASDFVEQVLLNTTASQPFSGKVTIQLFVSAGASTYVAEQFNFTNAAGDLQESITVDFDIGTQTSGPSAVTDVSVIATE